MRTDGIKGFRYLMAAATAALLAGCGQAGTAASGEIEIEGDRSEVALGESVMLRWSAEDAPRVYVRLMIDGEEGLLLNPAGYEPVGSILYTIDPQAVTFGEDDDVDVKFALLVADDDRPGEYRTLDETRALEVDRPASAVQ